MSFIAKFTNLQELELISYFEGFEKLQYTIFPQLQILKFPYSHLFPRYESLIKFLEINGGNLKELYLSDMRGNNDGSLNLAIAKFCTNLRKLSTRFKNDELETLKMIFNGCQYLESIKFRCSGGRDVLHFIEKDALEAAVKLKYPKTIRELLILHYKTMEKIKLFL